MTKTKNEEMEIDEELMEMIKKSRKDIKAGRTILFKEYVKKRLIE